MKGFSARVPRAEGPCGAAFAPGKQDPWIIRKAVVLIVMGLSAWACYVSIGRVCVPSIHEDKGAGFSRRTGIGLLVVFLVLWLMFMWSYVAIIMTPPGYARDHVPTCPDPPTIDPNAMVLPYPCDPPSSTPPSMLPANGEAPQDAQASENPFAEDNHVVPNSEPPSQPSEGPQPAAGHVIGYGYSSMGVSAGDSGKADYVRRPHPPVYITPRWCQWCKIIKPERTHHCRHCGTCVMQFDHHCVWIGRCVGWANHAIFISFNFWAGLFCLFNMVMLIVYQSMSDPVDPQKVVLMAICGFLCLFTLFMLLPTHIGLVLSGRTTLESFQTGAQQRAEAAALERVFHSSCAARDHRRVRRQWDDEYGHVAVNDRWAWGRPIDLWRQEMGTNWVGWILPIGRPRGDGLNFAANPRFGPHGEWLKMEDWPKVVSLQKKSICTTL